MYQVIGQAADLCTASDFVKVTVSAQTTVSPEVQTICHGTSTTLSASGADTYSWEPSTGLSATTGSSVTASPLQTTTYTVTGGLANCESSAEVTITVVKAAVSLTESFSICHGESKPLQASGAVSYTWSPSTGLSATNGANVVAHPTQTTTYTVTGTDAFNCTGTDEVTVSVIQLPAVTINPVEPICTGKSVTLSATGASSYNWTPETNLSTVNNASTVATPTETSTYVVTGTDSNGCSESSEVVVTVNPAPSIVVTQPSSICVGQTATLTASGANTYTWSPSTTLSSSTGNSVLASPLQSTVYTITGTGTNGCKNNASVNVMVIQINKPSITARYEDGWILSSSNPSGNLWFKNGVQIAGAISQSILVSSEGKYQVQISENGCLSELSEEYNLIVTSLESERYKDNIRLYPNPSLQFIYLSLDDFQSGKTMGILIKDVLGRSVANIEILYDGNNRIDVSNLPRGNYLLQVVQGPRIITSRFVIE